MIYVDKLTKYPGQNRLWCHLWSDNNLEELHCFAERIGLKVQWFQNRTKFPHYDLVANKRELALKYGAIEINLKDYIRMQNKETS